MDDSEIFNLWVTLWPSFGHFDQFSQFEDMEGIRLNSAMTSPEQLKKEISILNARPSKVPLWFDVKARQLRVVETIPDPNYLIIRINHPIGVELPTNIIFKGGEDPAILGSIEEDGYLLRMAANPRYNVKAGESFHIRHPSLRRLKKEIYTPIELEKIELFKAYGCKRWFISYVEDWEEVNQLRDIVGPGHEFILKIESIPGLKFTRTYKPTEDTVLCAACGDLYVELSRPSDILRALRLIIKADPEALAGSRILLSVHETANKQPSFADFTQLDWLKEAGYKRVMLCDSLCLNREELLIARNVFNEYKQKYVSKLHLI